MRRARALLLLVATLTLCGVVTAVATPGREPPPPPPVAWEIEIPPRAVVRESMRIHVRVENRGAEPIADLGLKLTRGYANVFTVIDTRPNARIDDATNERRLYFGPLAAGDTGLYQIVVSPQRVGEFSVTARIVAARRGFDPAPLADLTSGRLEIAATTVVADRPR